MADSYEQSSGSSSVSDKVSVNQKRKRTESSNSDSGGIPCWIAGSSPPRFVSLEELVSAARGINDMAIVHEIAFNEDFHLKISEPVPNSIEKHVHEAVHRAFWDLLAESLRSEPPQYDRALSLLQEIKDTLLSLLLPQHTTLREEIEEKLDIAFIRQQAEHSVIDCKEYAHYILRVMGRLCAPMRDEKLNELRNEEDLVALFRGILTMLDLMKIDMANFTVSAMRPSIQQHTVQYEKEKFEKYLEVSHDPLSATERWLADALKTLENEKCEERLMANPQKVSSAQNDASSSHMLSTITHGDVLSQGYLALLDLPEDATYPETLQTDVNRLISMRLSAAKLSLVAASIIVVGNVAGKQVSELPDFREALKEHFFAVLMDCSTLSQLNDCVPNIAEQAVNDCQNMPEKQGGDLPSSSSSKLKEMLKSQVTALANVDHPVRRLMRRRLLQFIGSVLMSLSASPSKIPAGLNAVQRELARLTGELLRLTAHNRSVFGDVYDSIIARLLAQRCEHYARTSQQ